MNEKSRRILMVNSFLYLIALTLALKISGIPKTGYQPSDSGLAKMNMWFRNLWKYSEGMGYSRFWYFVAGIISFGCIAMCCFWIAMCIADVIKSGRADGVGTDKNLMATFFLYVLTLISYFLLKLLKVNYGPIVAPGHTEFTCSFPSSHILLFIVAMGSTMFHIWDIWGERKKRARVVSVLCAVVMVLGIVAQTICGTIWLTDALGGLLLGITLLCFYSFFFYI